MRKTGAPTKGRLPLYDYINPVKCGEFYLRGAGVSMRVWTSEDTKDTWAVSSTVSRSNHPQSVQALLPLGRSQPL